MSYDYKTQRPFIFTDDGQRMFLVIRDKAKYLSEIAGAVSIGKLSVTGDSWDMLACIDRLIEIGEYRHVNEQEDVSTQAKVLRRVK